MTCPRCGASAEGNFCSACGASLQPDPCPSCGAKPEVGDRFCNNCGTFLEATGTPAVAGGAAPSSGAAKAGWWAAGALLVVLILAVSRSVFQTEGPPPPTAAAPAAGGGAAAVDLSSMTPREAADRLFNRVMRGVSSGDSGEVEGFLPMAIAAYERARPLDNDGTFHLALLHLTGLDFQAARAEAEEALAESPHHLLLLSVAAEAAEQAGDSETARAHYRTLLEEWDAQVSLELEEYEVHAPTLAEIREDARSFLDGG